jgi:hypothetical protein
VKYALAAVVAAVGVAFACADVSTSPTEAASIELDNFPSPSVVIGDTLRNEQGVVAPLTATVRNGAGEIIESTNVRFLYAEANRDTALRVDSVRGTVVARSAPTGQARVAARVGSALQVLRPLVVTVRPDTVIAGQAPSLLTTSFPDTGRSRANANSTSGLSVTVRNLQTPDQAAVTGWVVRFALERPANPSNDTTAMAFLVTDNGAPSVVDTTEAGTASRRVRIRAAQFPVSGTDTVIVRATVLYRGRPVAGSGVLLRAAVRRGTP